MNNEQKAKELGQKYQTPCHGVGDCEFEAYKAALEMAEWKEQQFDEEKKQWIYKVCEFLEQRNILEKDCSILASGVCNITFHPDKLINDLKQAMEE